MEDDPGQGAAAAGRRGTRYAVRLFADVAVELPMQMICIPMGIPESERHWLFEAIEPNFDFGASWRAAAMRMSVEEAGTRIYQFGTELIASKRISPTDDMLSVVTNAVLAEGSGPTDIELYLFFNLLFSAGAETTRNAIAGGLPRAGGASRSVRPAAVGSRAAAHGDRGDVALTTPSPSKRRTATATPYWRVRDAAGQKVLVWEGSANRDSAVFPTPTCSTFVVNPTRTWDSGRASTTPGRQPGPARTAGAVRGTAGASRRSRWPRTEWTRSNRHTGIRHPVGRFQ